MGAPETGSRMSAQGHECGSRAHAWPERSRSIKKRHLIKHTGEPSEAGLCPVLPFPRQCVQRGQLTGQMQSWYHDLLEDRLTHCGHSLDAAFSLTADRSSLLVALKRSTRIADRLESAR